MNEIPTVQVSRKSTSCYYIKTEAMGLRSLETLPFINYPGTDG